jgi:hypothetical protein
LRINKKQKHPPLKHETMAQPSVNHKKLVITLIILTISTSTIFLTKPAEASSKLTTIGDIKIYNENGTTELTTIAFQLFTPGQKSTQQAPFIIRNTGKHPIQVNWSISENSITWNKITKPKSAGYRHSEDRTEKYTLRIGQDIGNKNKYLQPERNSLQLAREESMKLFFELTYSGRPTTAEVFTLTIAFTATVNQQTTLIA